MSNLAVTGDIEAASIEASGLLTGTNGVKLPYTTTNNRPFSDAAGALIWNNSNETLEMWDGTKWNAQGGGPIPSHTESTKPSTNLSTGQFGWNTELEKFEVYNGTKWVGVRTNAPVNTPGLDQNNPATNAQAIYEADPTITDGLYWIDTANGGVTQIYCIFSNNRGWMVMGKFAADGSNTVANNPITTARGTVDNSSGTVISADFGDYQPQFQRFIGTDDITNWSNTRNLDWYFGVPSGRAFKRFWTSGQSSGMPRVRRNGFATNGAYDGRERWSNPGFNFMQMSDSDVTIDESYFTAPSNSLYFHNASDAKFAVDSSNSTSGQDESVMTQFGYDDSRRSFMDIYPNREGNNTDRRDYSSAVYVLLS